MIVSNQPQKSNFIDHSHQFIIYLSLPHRIISGSTMLRTVRNLLVNIIAAFISDREARHRFRNKYKRKSKFRKLRDDNKILFNENKIIRNDIQSLRKELAALRTNYNQHLWEREEDKCLIYRVAPLDNSPPRGPETNVYLAIAAVAKNEGPYLREWIEYHKIVGVERFYFYDNESDDNTKEILEPYITDGTVVYHFLPNHPISRQVPIVEAYNDAIFKYRDRTRWMAIIDIDEFLVPVEKNSIPEFLVDYEQYPGVVVNWVFFDSNGHDTKPTAHGGLLTANYTRVRKNHDHSYNNIISDKVVKTIVNPKQVVNYISEHIGLFYRHRAAVTENYQGIRGISTSFHSSAKIRLNHYKTKSREEYLSKITRNNKNTQNSYIFKEALVNFQEETTEDLVIQKYVPQLKQALEIKD